MEHVGTICTHCSDGCKTTLGVRNGEIIRGNNRDRSGINGEFLCIKGRYAFDFNQQPGAAAIAAAADKWRIEAGFMGQRARDRRQEVFRSKSEKAASSA